jgi:integrase
MSIDRNILGWRGLLIKKHFLAFSLTALMNPSITLLFAGGAFIKDVQARLGHTDTQTTITIYTHVTVEAKEKTAEVFQRYMTF